MAAQVKWTSLPPPPPLSLSLSNPSPSLQELSPPLVDEFLYLCDDAYTRNQILAMEREILLVLGYDINVPVAYRFLRRLARVSLMEGG